GEASHSHLHPGFGPWWMAGTATTSENSGNLPRRKFHPGLMLPASGGLCEAKAEGGSFWNAGYRAASSSRGGGAIGVVYIDPERHNGRSAGCDPPCATLRE